MECSISFQNGDPNLGKPSGAHVRRSAARAGRPQGFLAGVLHFAGWCLHTAALRDGGLRLPFRLSDSGVRPGSETRTPLGSSRRTLAAGRSLGVCGQRPSLTVTPLATRRKALPLCNIPEWLVSFQNDRYHLRMICVILEC